MAQDSVPAPGAEETCTRCGHPWNPHVVMGYGDPPTEGWIECPVEGCTCRMTWSMGADSGGGADAAEPAAGE